MGVKMNDLEAWLKKECDTASGPYLRPFAPNPDWQKAEVFVIGTNPATPIRFKSFDEYWNALTQYPENFQKEYRRKHGKKEESKTTKNRRKLTNELDGINVLVTNVSWLPAKNEKGINSNDFDLGRKRLKRLLDDIGPKVIFAYGTKARDFVDTFFDGVPDLYASPEEQGKSRRKPLVLTYPHLSGQGIMGGKKFQPDIDLAEFAKIIKRRLGKEVKGRSPKVSRVRLQIMDGVKSKNEKPAKLPARQVGQESLFILDFKETNVGQFKTFWAARYSDTHENLYEEYIEKTRTEKTIMQLYNWKNGGNLAALKRESVKRNYKPYRGVWKDRIDLPSDEELIKEISKDSAIWRIFWLHCQNPCEFPIYDQHVHRAMMFIEGNRSNLEISSSEKTKAETYFHQFLPFFKRHFKKPSDWRKMREADKALFAFGKFIKSGWSP